MRPTPAENVEDTPGYGPRCEALDAQPPSVAWAWCPPAEPGWMARTLAALVASARQLPTWTSRSSSISFGDESSFTLPTPGLNQ